MNWIKKKLFNSKLGNNIKEIFIKKFPSKEEQNESKYISCHSTPVLKEDLENNLWSCDKCGKNHRISPRYRFDNIIFVKSQWTEIPAPVPKDDPLNFSDAKGRDFVLSIFLSIFLSSISFIIHPADLMIKEPYANNKSR